MIKSNKKKNDHFKKNFFFLFSEKSEKKNLMMSSSIPEVGLTRRQVDKVFNEDTGKYEYTYELYQDGKLVGSKVITVKKIENTKVYYDECKDEQTIVDLCIKYFKDRNIKISSLYKISVLNTYLKSIRNYILNETNITIYQYKIKEIIRKKIFYKYNDTDSEDEN